MPESEAVSMEKNVSVNALADAIMDTLGEYADLAAEDVKQAVKNAGDAVRDDIRSHAPKDTGDYAKSWAVKKMKETSDSLTVVVHSRNRGTTAHRLRRAERYRKVGGRNSKSTGGMRWKNYYPFWTA